MKPRNFQECSSFSTLHVPGDKREFVTGPEIRHTCELKI